VPAGPKPGAALHHSVTTGSVKKALTLGGWINHRVGYEIAGGVIHRS
jgi:hypothetical protein